LKTALHELKQAKTKANEAMANFEGVKFVQENIILNQYRKFHYKRTKNSKLNLF